MCMATTPRLPRMSWACAEKAPSHGVLHSLPNGPTSSAAKQAAGGTSKSAYCTDQHFRSETSASGELYSRTSGVELEVVLDVCLGDYAVNRSTDRILTTHVGSLVRTPAILRG